MTLEFLWFPTNKCFINGSWASPNSGQTLKLLNPSTGKVLVSVANSNSNDVDDALVAAEMALLGEWGKKTALDRGRVLTKMSQLVRNYAPELAKLFKKLFKLFEGLLVENGFWEDELAGEFDEKL